MCNDTNTILQRHRGYLTPVFIIIPFPSALSKQIGANAAMSAELVSLFLYGAFLSFILIFSLRMMETYRKDEDDTNVQKQIQFHEYEMNNSDATSKMSADEDQQSDHVSCSSCSISEDDDTHFNPESCDNCDLVQCCGSDDCEKEHMPAHDESCQKRAAAASKGFRSIRYSEVEAHDKILFQQPESTHLGDCPICLVPLPDDVSACVMESCCSVFVCIGCSHANRQRELEGDLEQRCPFCRVTPPATNEEGEARKMKRVEANDPVALCEVGKKHYHDGDFSAAFEYWTRAVEGEGPGAVDAHDNLAILYKKGLGGVEKDEQKELYHLKMAAIAGHPSARYNLANYEGRHGRNDIAVKHLVIAVKQGSSEAIQTLKKMYGQGMINKEGFAACLRAYQKAVEATKSPQRELAAKSVAQGLNPWDRVQTQGQSQTQRQRPLDRTRPVNGTRGKGGKKSSKKGKGKQSKQHEEQKSAMATSTCKQPPPPKKL